MENRWRKFFEVVNEINIEHKNIIVFIPTDKYFEQLPSKITRSKKNFRDFVKNHVYAGYIDTVMDWALGWMEPNKGKNVLELKSLNGTVLRLDKKGDGLDNIRLNGMKVGYGWSVEKDDRKRAYHMIHGLILS